MEPPHAADPAPATPAPATPAPGASRDGVLLPVRSLPMPGGAGPLHTDYNVYDAPTHTVWIPTGTRPRVDVFDTAANTFRSVTPFPTTSIPVRGGVHILGPSSSTIGEGVVYVGDRSDRRVCAVDLHTLAIGNCVTLAMMPDGVTYVASRHELWVTAPRDNSLIVVRAEANHPLAVTATIHLEDEPEGYAVDARRGWFFTNFKEHDETVAFDMATHRIVARWSLGCGRGGARGLLIAPADDYLFAACWDHSVTLDMAHAGAHLGSVAAGEGVDDMAYWPERRLLYLASGDEGVLRVAHVGPHGELELVAHAPTAESARNAVVDEHGRAYIVDSYEARLYIVEPPPAP